MKSIQAYYQAVHAANTEEARKQLFKDLLVQLYGKDTEAKAIIQEMSLGAEKAVLNIPLARKTAELEPETPDNATKTGRADAQYGRVIIEFERDMRRTGEHAKDQLREYFSGNWNTGNRLLFTLIATDCVHWEVYGIDPLSVLGQTEVRPESLRLVTLETFTLGPEMDVAERFFHFLDRHLFHTELLQPSIEAVQREFGANSLLFLDAIAALKRLYHGVSEDPELITAYNQWDGFLSLAYGKFQATPDTFLTHTYLSILAKLMAYAVLSGKPKFSDEDMAGLLEGEAFAKLNVTNFVENDFFRWVATPKYLPTLLPTIRQIALKVTGFDYAKVHSDILKGVYQEMVDLETRHTLGEYYTPDWLCAEMIAHAAPAPDAQILDPSCGSGSFLLAAIAYLRRTYPTRSGYDIAAQVVGIDIHPLSVQIAKTTFVLALGRSFAAESGRPLHIPVYLANSLVSPEGTRLFQSSFFLKINQHEYELPQSLFTDNRVFDRCVAVADELADTGMGSPPKPIETLKNALARADVQFQNGHYDKLYELYKGLKRAKEEGRDGIWKFILQNSYKPFFLKQSFDLVIGNPPWVTLADIPNGEYQNLLRALAVKYDQKPSRVANMPHLEIAALFMSHAGSYYLKAGGKMGFVLPRSFLTASHHEPTRTGLAQGFRLNEVWDMERVQNLFRVPCTVLWATQAHVLKQLTTEGLPGRVYTGKPPRHNASAEEAQGKVRHTEVRFHLAKMNKNTALSTGQVTEGGENPYHALFRQGATIVPRCFYFINLLLPTPPDWDNRLLPCETLPLPEAKAPWKSIKMKGRLSSDFFFRTALAKNLAPFSLLFPPIVTLPIKNNEGEIQLLNSESILEDGYLETAKWLKTAEQYWDKHKTDNNKKANLYDYLNWNQKLSSQSLTSSYLVLYTASAKDANAIVVIPSKLDLPFIVDYTAYYFATETLEEAHYITCFLNSNSANCSIKPFQAKGLFGPRHVSKKILDVPLPLYDAANPQHQALAALGAECATRAAAEIATMGLNPETYNIGKVRTALRAALVPELKRIDALLAKIGGQ